MAEGVGVYHPEPETDDDTVPLLSPGPGGRKGPKPVFRELRSMQHEADSIAREIDKRRKAGTSLGEIGVLR